MGPASKDSCSYKEGRWCRHTENEVTWRWRQRLELHIYKPRSVMDCWQALEAGRDAWDRLPQWEGGAAECQIINQSELLPLWPFQLHQCPPCKASPASSPLPSCHHIRSVFPSLHFSSLGNLTFLPVVFAGPIAGFDLGLAAFLTETTSSWNGLLTWNLPPMGAAHCSWG